MYRNRKIGLVIPAYNEAKLIGSTLQGVPEYFDRVYVVDDCSPDQQNEVVLRHGARDSRITLLQHETNQGPGGAIITGYRKASQDSCDIVVVVGGDFQMDLNEAPRFLNPIVDGRADYTKGNRFLIEKLEETIERMPKLRFFGNWVITALTKVASGYFNVMDVVDGYTAISKRAIDTIDWNRAWKQYGYPMDFLIRLNAYGYKVLDVPRTSIYLPGERQSQIKAFNYTRRVAPMLLRAFLWRLRFKYVYLDFHPLVFFYGLALALVPPGLCLGGYMLFDKIFADGKFVTAPRAILCSLFLLTGTQFLLFAMFFDREQSSLPTQTREELYDGLSKASHQSHFKNEESRISA